MLKYKVVNIEMKDVDEIELSDVVFGAPVKKHLIHEAVKAYLANQRAGNASTKTRAEVRGSNVKPYRQKGTGRARHGTWSSPIFVGGGITFGPKPRDFSLKLTKKKRRAALVCALSLKNEEKKLLILDKWVEKKKTKEMAEVFKNMKVKNGLIVLGEPTTWFEKVVKNIPHIDVVYANELSTYNIIAHDFLICTKDVVAKIQEGLVQ